MNGINVSTPNHNVSDTKNLAFTSRNDYLKLDVRHSPKFFDFVKYTVPASTTFPAFGVNAYQDIISINHGLGYVPEVLVYFYSYDFSGSYVAPNGYQLGSMGLTSAGFFQESFHYYVDTSTFVVYYQPANGKPGDLGGNAATAAGFSFGVKYYIFSNELK